MAKIIGKSARYACVFGLLILACGVAVTVCGSVWLYYGGYHGHGIWSGLPLIFVGLLGIAALTRHKLTFHSYVFFSFVVSILAGVQAVTAGMQYAHWKQFIGPKKCSVKDGVCSCTGLQRIKIRDMKTCDDIPSINMLLIAMIVMSVFGVIFCLAGAIIGCIGLSTVPQSTPATLKRKPKPPSGTMERPLPAKHPLDHGYHGREDTLDKKIYTDRLDDRDKHNDKRDYDRDEYDRGYYDRGSDRGREYDRGLDRGKEYERGLDRGREYDRYSDRGREYDDRGYDRRDGSDRRDYERRRDYDQDSDIGRDYDRGPDRGRDYERDRYYDHGYDRQDYDRDLPRDDREYGRHDYEHEKRSLRSSYSDNEADTKTYL